ncbi:amino acid decarboxylase [Virgibacillus kekensis]|uniref:Amino acid decarboxylase n=1 Tax=Virgibacillus kekensis TaxID=202261 RepID=A0ABV9DP53_9BACI
MLAGQSKKNLNVQFDGQRALIDLRQHIANGEHPGNEVFDYVKEVPVGTIIELHVPHRQQPLIGGLEKFGLNVIVSQLGPEHFRLVAVKINDI